MIEPTEKDFEAARAAVVVSGTDQELSSVRFVARAIATARAEGACPPIRDLEKQALEMVRQIAALPDEDEKKNPGDEDGWGNDDAWSALIGLIAQARGIVGKPPST